MNWMFQLLFLTAFSIASAKWNFILTGPKLYDVGENETLVLRVNGGGVARLSLNSNYLHKHSRVVVRIENGKSTSVQLPVPSDLAKHTTARLLVEMVTDRSRIIRHLTVGLRTKTPIVFVNTDKPIYRAGQTVKIRVLVTDSNLRPYKNDKVGEIWITDPNGDRIEQWTEEPLDTGLIHKTLLLPEEPSLGKWWINAKIDDRIATKSFEVKEYVLPTFEVKITPPSDVLITAENSTWQICARYTYGKPVKGELLTKLKTSYYDYDARKQKNPYIESSTHIKGCTKLTIPLAKLRTKNRSFPFNKLELYAEVTEEGTGTKMNSTATVSPTRFPYAITRIVDLHPSYFRPGIPLRMAMALRTYDSKPVPDELIDVCMEVIRKKWREGHTVTDHVNVCRNYTSDEDGNIHFTIPPQDPNTVFLTIYLETAVWQPKEEVDGHRLWNPSHLFSLRPWFSASGSHIQLQRIPKLNCSAFGPDAKFILPFYISYKQTEIKKMYYQVMSRGDIVRYGDFDLNLEAGNDTDVTDATYLPDYRRAECTESDIRWDSEAKPAKYVSQHYLHFKLDRKMIPRIRVLLFTVTEDGDIVADSVSFNTDPCFANQVEMRFGEKQQSPGDKATIHLKAEPQSLCSVGVVDKSVYILQQEDLLSGSEIAKHLIPLDTTSNTQPDQISDAHEYCSTKERDPRQYYGHYEPVDYLDAIFAFGDSGSLVLSDRPLATRPCWRTISGRRHYPYYEDYPTFVTGLSLDSDDTETEPSQHRSSPVVTVRTEFPDTWLFDLYKVSDQGSLEIEQKMPDSVTEWQGQAVCVHPDKGLGVSQQASIIGFQPFFASLTLPYSVVRNETVPVIVTVFNYLKDCLPIKVHLHRKEHFSLYNGTLTRSMCICLEESATTYFHITPRNLGTLNATVTAETTGDKEVCGNFDAALDVKRSDTLTKPVLVEAEGFTKEDVFNSLLCVQEEEGEISKTEHLLKLPETKILARDSARAYTSLTGDLMGPTLEGLDRLVKMPTGCGEQNMIGLVPNIVVLDYLKATNKLTEELRLKAVGHIRQGYARQQEYRHSRGSYSAFGKRDKEGSMWLTAFVVRTFGSARRYINIDENTLELSKEWILSRQREDGCFPMVGTVHHKAMKGGVSNEDETSSTLTAYILISMLESGNMTEEAVAKGLRCIKAKSKPSNYSLSLFAYATALAKHNSSSEYMEQLVSGAERDAGLLYWNDRDRSVAVETASYVILTLLESERKDLPRVASIAKWIAKQRNSYGGFYSTQDTVMALQALGKYGSVITSKPPEMGIYVKTDKVDEKFQINPENQLLMQRMKLKLEEEPETKVEIVANGSGCALVQTSLRYNIIAPSVSEDFNLTVKTQRESGGCSDVEVQICASYNHPDGSNMAIIEIKMVTGYSPVIDTVKKLLQVTDLEVKRYEFPEGSNTLFLYVQTLTQNGSCFSFDVTQEIRVLDAKPSSVKVYDYYDEGKSLSAPYFIEETCMD